MHVECGEIYWAENKSAEGHEYRKERPYLIIDTNEFICQHSVISAVPLTTRMSGCQPSDVFIHKNAGNSLIGDSLAKVNQIYSFDKSRFQKFIGKVDYSVIRKIHQNLRQRFYL